MNTSHRLIVAMLLLSGFTVAIAAQNAGPDWPQCAVRTATAPDSVY
jgi:hypothetical protein